MDFLPPVPPPDTGAEDDAKGVTFLPHGGGRPSIVGLAIALCFFVALGVGLTMLIAGWSGLVLHLLVEAFQWGWNLL